MTIDLERHPTTMDRDAWSSIGSSGPDPFQELLRRVKAAGRWTAGPGTTLPRLPSTS